MNEMRKLMEATDNLFEESHGIEWMTLINVESESREWAEFDVHADDLAFAYPDVQVNSLDPDAFFFLACEYLESFEDDVISTDQAKIGQWRSSSKLESEIIESAQDGGHVQAEDALLAVDRLHIDASDDVDEREPVRTLNQYVSQSEGRLRELESLLTEAQGILIDSMLDEGYSDWMERVNQVLGNDI